MNWFECCVCGLWGACAIAWYIVHEWTMFIWRLPSSEIFADTITPADYISDVLNVGYAHLITMHIWPRSSSELKEITIETTKTTIYICRYSFSLYRDRQHSNIFFGSSVIIIIMNDVSCHNRSVQVFNWTETSTCPSSFMWHDAIQWPIKTVKTNQKRIEMKWQNRRYHRESSRTSETK